MLKAYLKAKGALLYTHFRLKNNGSAYIYISCKNKNDVIENQSIIEVPSLIERQFNANKQIVYNVRCSSQYLCLQVLQTHFKI